ncbi:MAG TPA: protease complex subunit PrcB family protein [Vicinamibacterales bacterium]|nr:protease complex subunit PrcB family protein [Vicinamibacterales bacterium]
MTSAIETIGYGEGSRVTTAHRQILRTEEEWRELWRAHAGPELAPPVVDFDTRMVAAAFAGERPTPGWEIAISGTRRDGAALVLLVTERHPPASAMAAQILSSPFHIVTVPRYDGAVRFEAADAVPAAAMRASTPPRRHEAAPSSTGLSPRTAAVLAYLAGPLSGALLLALEQSSRFVRFHAFQALVGLGVLSLAGLLFLLLAFLLLLVSPAAFWALLWLAAATGVAWLLIWAACLFQAYKGRLWKLPIAGVYAARWARLQG